MNKTENTASRLTDAVEGAFYRGVMTHEEYVRCLKAINEWALGRYSKLAADAPVIVGFAETEKVAEPIEMPQPPNLATWWCGSCGAIVKDQTDICTNCRPQFFYQPPFPPDEYKDGSSRL